MARSRKSATQEPQTTSTNERQGRTMAGLTADQIAALLGKTRQKGVYIQYLNQFLESGESGICVNEQWVDMKDKKASTLKQGFENAKENKEAGEGSEFVKVIANEEKVYLINLQAAGVDTPETAEATA
jgi:hypothetical protein